MRTIYSPRSVKTREREEGGGRVVLNKSGMGALNCIMNGMEFLIYENGALNFMDWESGIKD